MLTKQPPLSMVKGDLGPRRPNNIIRLVNPEQALAERQLLSIRSYHFEPLFRIYVKDVIEHASTRQ